MAGGVIAGVGHRQDGRLAELGAEAAVEEIARLTPNILLDVHSRNALRIAVVTRVFVADTVRRHDGVVFIAAARGLLERYIPDLEHVFRTAVSRPGCDHEHVAGDLPRV